MGAFPTIWSTSDKSNLAAALESLNHLRTELGALDNPHRRVELIRRVDEIASRMRSISDGMQLVDDHRGAVLASLKQVQRDLTMLQRDCRLELASAAM